MISLIMYEYLDGSGYLRDTNRAHSHKTLFTGRKL
jgi:hypothetical protein